MMHEKLPPPTEVLINFRLPRSNTHKNIWHNNTPRFQYFISLKHREDGKWDNITTILDNYKVVQIWPKQTVTCLHTIGHIWTALYIWEWEWMEMAQNRVFEFRDFISSVPIWKKNILERVLKK